MGRIHIRGRVSQRAGAAVEGDVFLAVNNGSGGLGCFQFIGNERVVHYAGGYVRRKADAKGIGAADRQDLFRVFYGDGRVAVGEVDLGSGADIGGDIGRTGAVDGGDNGLFAHSVDFLEPDLVAEVAEDRKILTAVHHVDFIETGGLVPAFRVRIGALYDEDGRIAGRDGPFVHIHGSAGRDDTVCPVGEVCLARIALVDLYAGRHDAGIDAFDGIEIGVILIIHHKITGRGIVGGDGAFVRDIHDGKGVDGKMGVFDGICHDGQLGEIAHQRDEGHFVGRSVLIQVEVGVYDEFRRGSVITGSVLVGVDAVVEKDPLPIGVLAGRTCQFGHDDGFIVEFQALRTVGDQMDADAGSRDGEGYLVAFPVGFAFLGNIVILCDRFGQVVFLKVPGTAEDGDVEGRDFRLLAEGLGGRIRFGQLHTEVEGHFLAFVIHFGTLFDDFFLDLFPFTGEGQERREGRYNVE